MSLPNRLYYENLSRQYQDCTGVKDEPLCSMENLIKFTNWLGERRNIGKKYFDFLLENNIIDEEYQPVEINKGEFDSLVINKNIPIISPYLCSIENHNADIWHAIFTVYNGLPLIEGYERNSRKICYEFDKKHNFILVNPYKRREFTNWHQLHKDGQKITLGIYGKNTDINKISNLRLYDGIKGKLQKEYIEYNQEDEENYFYVLTSKHKC